MKYLLPFLLSCQLVAQDSYSWTKTDTVLEAIFETELIIDWGQTLYIQKHPEKFYETNTLLGKHPSRARINNHFLLFAILHPVVAAMLPVKWRRAFQYIYIGVETAAIGNNVHLGIHITF